MSRAPRSMPFSPDDAEMEVGHEIPNLFRAIPDLAAGATPTAEALIEALIFTSHALKQFVNGCMEGAPGMPRLSMPRAHLLLVVAEAGSVRMGDLSRVLGVTPRNVTSLVDAIESEGLILRRPDPGDRRAILLELSEEGNALMEQIHGVQQSVAEQVFAPLNADERRTFYDLLRRLADEAARTRSAARNSAVHSSSERHPRWHHEANGRLSAEEKVAANRARREQAATVRKAHREQANARKRLGKFPVRNEEQTE